MRGFCDFTKYLGLLTRLQVERIMKNIIIIDDSNKKLKPLNDFLIKKKHNVIISYNQKKAIKNIADNSIKPNLIVINSNSNVSLVQLMNYISSQLRFTPIILIDNESFCDSDLMIRIEKILSQFH